MGKSIDSKARAGVLAFLPSPKMAPWRAEWRAATGKERYHGIRNEDEKDRLAGAVDRLGHRGALRQGLAYAPRALSRRVGLGSEARHRPEHAVEVEAAHARGCGERREV